MATIRIVSAEGFTPQNNARVGQLQAPAGVGAGEEILGTAVSAIGEQLEKERDASFIANATVDATDRVRQRMEALKQDYAENPQGYADAAKTVAQEEYNSITEKAPSQRARMALENQFAGMTQGNIIQAAGWERKASLENYTTKHMESLSKLGSMVYSDPATYQQAVEQNKLLLESAKTFLDPLDVMELEQKSKGTLAEANIRGMIERSPNTAKKMLASGQFDDVFDFRAKETLNNAADRQVAHFEVQARKQEVAAQQQRDSVFFDNLASAKSVADFNTLKTELDRGFETGAIDGKKYLQMEALVTKRSASFLEETTFASEMADAMNNGVPMDVNNAKDKAKAEAYFNQNIARTADGEAVPSIFTREAETFVRQTGYVPEALNKQVTRTIAAGTPQERIKAANFINAAASENPKIFKQFDEKTASEAVRMSTLHAAGLPPTEAVEAAKRITFEKNTEPYKVREADLKKAFGTTAKPKKLDISGISKYTDAYDSSAPVPAGLTSDFKDIMTAHYMSNESVTLDDAKDYAAKRVASRWGVTQVGANKKWMKDSPELVYNPRGQDPSWIKESLRNTVKDNLPDSFVKAANSFSVVGFDPVGSMDSKKDPRGFAADKLMNALEVTVYPPTRNTDQPVYALTYKDSSGIKVLTDNKGEPVLWRPNFQNSKDVKETMGETKKDRKAAEARAIEEKAMLKSTSQDLKNKGLPPLPIAENLP
jgi:hypothetical protein